MNRTVRRHRARIAAVLGFACAIGVVATPASAANGDKLTAVVHGKKLKLTNKTVCAGYTTAAVSITGGTKFHHLGQVLRAFVIACDVDLTTTALPVSPSICSIGYTETGTSLRHPTSKAWGSTSTPDNPVIQVTISSFAGGRVRGTFSGTLAGETSGTPATAVRGTFSVTAVLNGNNCTPV
jgi:hypothetical protein